MSSNATNATSTVDVQSVRPLPGILSRGSGRPNLFVQFSGSPLVCGSSPKSAPPTETPGKDERRSCGSDSASCLSSYDPQASECTPAVSGKGLATLSLKIMTPQSCTSSCRYVPTLTPRTPDPFREDLKLFSGCVHCILFDFDGTLTATPGEMSLGKGQKTTELCERAAILAPPLRVLRDANILLGIISKNTESTIRSSLQAAGLSELFTGPIVGKAVGLEGKAGFIEDLILSGHLGHAESADLETSLQQILLVDDDVRELDRARTRGIQTFPAPANGGMQDEDFNDLLAELGLCVPKPWQQDLTASQSPISVTLSVSPSSRM